MRDLGDDLRSTAPPLDDFVEHLRRLLDADRAVAYCARAATRGYALDFAVWSGFRQSRRNLTQQIRDRLRATPRPWALFDPLRPPVGQRNVAVNLPPAGELSSASGRALLRRLGFDGGELGSATRRMRRLESRVLHAIELGGLHSCRVLVCDGPLLLGFVGVFRDRAFGLRERVLLGRLVPAMAARLTLERTLSDGDRRGVSIAVLLEVVPTAAYVVRPNGVIEHANARGVTLLREEGGLVDELERVVRCGCSLRFVAHRVGDGALPDYLLVTEIPSATEAAARLRAVAEAWRLTARQHQVLESVALGSSNKEIAAVLGCSTRTVEYHVTQLLTKSATASRTELVAHALGATAGPLRVGDD